MSYVFSYKKISDEKHKMRFTKKIKQFSRSAQLFFFGCMVGMRERERRATSKAKSSAKAFFVFPKKKVVFLFLMNF